MNSIKHVIGIDISTQTVSAMLIGVVEVDGRPVELVISSAWVESRVCRDEFRRKSPGVWIELVRECVAGLKRKAREAETAEAIGVSTTFPGCFAILCGGEVDAQFVSLYDNTDDAGICSGEYETELGRAESETCSRMWPGNMAIGLARMMIRDRLRLDMVDGIVPPNTAFSHQLMRLVGVDAAELITDFSQAAIGGLYDARSGEPVPSAVDDLLTKAVPGMDSPTLRSLLPRLAPAWRNTIPADAVGAVGDLLGLAKLKSISIGAGDSPLGALALISGADTVINVRGSSDSPMIIVDSPRSRDGARENVLHYPLPTATRLSDSGWCVVAPMLRSGRVWDWVRRLRFDDDSPNADVELERLARQAATNPEKHTLRFDTALGGERAPDWDSTATGMLQGLVESHNIGDIALAALEGMSATLKKCIKVMEQRYDVRPEKLLLVGGPARNRLWNRITQQGTGKKTFATTFSDASLLGAALLGYGSAYDGLEPDSVISKRLSELSGLSASHRLIAPQPVEDI